MNRIYVKNDPARAALCVVTLHGLLHVADYIQAIGPVWASWAFPMERYCGQLTPHIKNRRSVWANINSIVTNLAHLHNVTIKYNLGKELSLKKPAFDHGDRIIGCM
jgi:hypothetical protein